MCLLGAPAHRNWLLGHLHLQVPVQAPCHLSLQQTNVLPILVMKKCKLRAGKGFIQGGTANHHPQCTCTCKLPPHPELSGGTLAPTTKMLAWGPLHQLQRLKKLSGNSPSPFCLSHWHLVGPGGASQTEGRTVHAPSKGGFHAGERELTELPQRRQPRARQKVALPGSRGEASIRMDCLGGCGIGPPCLDFPPLNVCVSLHLCHFNMLREALGVALAAPAAASFEGAALQRMESGAGRVQHKCVLSCVGLMWDAQLLSSRGLREGSPKTFSISPSLPHLVRPLCTSLSASAQ